VLAKIILRSYEVDKNSAMVVTAAGNILDTIAGGENNAGKKKLIRWLQLAKIMAKIILRSSKLGKKELRFHL
jgi:hypothetical protein